MHKDGEEEGEAEHHTHTHTVMSQCSLRRVANKLNVSWGLKSLYETCDWTWDIGSWDIAKTAVGGKSQHWRWVTVPVHRLYILSWYDDVEEIFNSVTITLSPPCSKSSSTQTSQTSELLNFLCTCTWRPRVGYCSMWIITAFTSRPNLCGGINCTLLKLHGF